MVFDDLDLHLGQAPHRDRALAGLLSLILQLDSQNIDRLVFKVMLRQDMWEPLVFPNKNAFRGRDVDLRWGRADVLRVALRQAYASEPFSKLCKTLGNWVEDLDTASEDELRKGLEPLWGVQVGKARSKYVSHWVFDRLSDGNKAFYPRALQVLLQRALVQELEHLGNPATEPKHDRLLRFQSLVDGLRRTDDGASAARVEELIEEHPDLQNLKGALANHTSPISDQELRSILLQLPGPLRGLGSAEAPDGATRPRNLDEEVRWLQQIGLLNRADAEGAPTEHAVAELYLWGLGMRRPGGP